MAAQPTNKEVLEAVQNLAEQVRRLAAALERANKIAVAGSGGR